MGEQVAAGLKKENKFLLKDFISDPSAKESFVFE